MKKYLLALLIFFSFSAYSQTIDINGIGEFKIGMDSSELFQKLSNYEYLEYLGYHYFYTNDETHIVAWTDQNSRIRGLGTENPIFSLNNGIRVGSTIKDVLKYYPNAKLGHSHETDEEYLSILDDLYQVGDKKRTMILFVNSNNGESLSLGDIDEESTEFSTDGIVSRIEMYNWN